MAYAYILSSSQDFVVGLVVFMTSIFDMETFCNFYSAASLVLCKNEMHYKFLPGITLLFIKLKLYSSY